MGRAIPDNEINWLGGEPSAVGSSKGMSVAEPSAFEVLSWVLIMDSVDEFAVIPVRGFEADRHMHYD